MKKIDLRTITIQDLQGQRILIPNKDVFSNPVVNYTELNRRRVDISCGVSYKTDLKQAKQVVIKAVKKIKVVDTSLPIEFFYQEFGESAIVFQLRFWVDFRQEPDFLEARSLGIVAVKQALNEAKIVVPFPIRTLQIEGKPLRKLKV